MTSLLEFLGSPLAHGLLHALGWTLLHFLWQGAIVAAILWCALQLLAGQSSQVRYLATCLAFLALVTLPLITFARLTTAAVKNAQATWDSSIVIDPAMMLQVNVGAVAATWPARMALALDHRMPWLLAVWLAGAIFFVARLNYGLLVATRLKSAGTEPPSAEFSEMFEDMKQRLGINRAVRLLHSARVQVPTVIGWLRPVVLIPASCLTGLSTAQIEAIFCHELAHVRRHDYLVSVFQSIAEALLFYHPAVWWISKQVRRERECCCDEIAVSNGGDVLAYARALSFLEERRASFPEFVLGANGGVLSMRIKRLLGYKSDTPASQFAALALLAIMITIAGSYVASVAHAATETADTSVVKKVVANVTGEQNLHTVPTAAVASRPISPGATDLQFEVEGPTVPASELAAKSPAPAIPQVPSPGQPMFVPMETMDANSTYKVLPVYPDIAKAAHVKGMVVLRVTISKSGDVGNLRATAGPTMLWSSAMDAVRQWKYKPYLLNGEPQQVDTDVLVNFHLAPDGTASVDLQPDPVRAVRVSAGIVANQQLYKVDPIYPADAKASGVQGPVVLNAMIAGDGSVDQLRIISGPPELQQSALDAVKQWRFKPYLLNGQPTEIQTTITVNYSLEGSSASQEQGSAQQYGIASEYNGAPLRRVGNGVSTPVVIYEVEPEFSEQARQAKFMGMVLVTLIVDQNGTPQNVHILRGVGMGLDEKALEAVKQYRFRPAMENGRPVAVALNVEVNFQIFDKPPAHPASAEGARTVPTIAVNSAPLVSISPSAQSPDATVRKVGGGVSSPVVISSVSPEYSPEARKAKTQGIVLVNLIVDQQGIPQKVRVIRGLPDGLDERAVEAVRQYRFTPAMENGRPVPVELNVEVNFKFF